jgi:hypothetical protein
VPENADDPDEPVFLCAVHFTAYEDLRGPALERITPEMRDFMNGLSREVEAIDPSTELRPPARADSLPSEPVIPPPPTDHGFSGRYGDLFDHAFSVCYDVSYRGVMADPPGSGPAVFSAKRAVPIDAIGTADRDNAEDMAAVEAGCRAGQIAAFSDTGFAPPADWPQAGDG